MMGMWRPWGHRGNMMGMASATMHMERWPSERTNLKNNALPCESGTQGLRTQAFIKLFNKSKHELLQ